MLEVLQHVLLHKVKLSTFFTQPMEFAKNGRFSKNVCFVSHDPRVRLPAEPIGRLVLLKVQKLHFCHFASFRQLCNNEI